MPQAEITVGIVVRNGRDSVERQIRAITDQVCSCSWELVISDGGSTDGTLEAVRELATSAHGSIRVIEYGRSGIAGNRNFLVSHAYGRKILFCDADDLVTPGWIDAMSSALQDAAIVAGRIHPMSAHSDENELRRAYDSGWEGSTVGPSKRHRYLPFGLTSNLGFDRALFDELGGFSEEMETGEDVDFVWRAQEAGHQLAFAEESIVLYQSRDNAWDRFRQHFRFGLSEPLLFKRHRDYGMTRSLLEPMRSWAWLVLRVIPALWGSQRTEWARVLGHRLGSLVGSFKYRTIYL